MTIRKKFRGKVSPQDRVRRNEEIRVSPLRVINEKGEQVGVIDRDEALRMAAEAELDLVEVQSDVRPPLVKIMDYGKYRFEQSKRKSAAYKKSKQNETKEIRLGRSVKIDQHDVALRMQQARKFLLEGYKVNFVQRFRGREMAHPDIGQERLKKIAEALADIAQVQTPPKMNGRQMTMLLNPDRRKVEALKRKLEKDSPKGEGTEEAQAPTDAPEAAAQAADDPKASPRGAPEAPAAPPADAAPTESPAAPN